MAGKNCTGAVTNNADLIKESRAFCEGLSYRSQGSAVSFPVTDNPHDDLSDAGTAWSIGWVAAENAGTLGQAVNPAAAPCCAVSRGAVSP